MAEKLSIFDVPRSAKDISYDLDHKGVLCYWNNGFKLMEPAKPIEDPDLFIGIVGLPNILPSHMSLKPKDLVDTIVSTEDGNAIGIVKPGLSGFLFFGDKTAKQENRELIIRSHLGREPYKKNKIYIAQTRDIVEQGWTPIYTPLIDKKYPIYNPLHVILTPNSIIKNETSKDATENEKMNLANVFVKWE